MTRLLYFQWEGCREQTCCRQGFAPDYPGRPIVKNGMYTSEVIGNLKAGGKVITKLSHLFRRI